MKTPATASTAPGHGPTRLESNVDHNTDSLEEWRSIPGYERTYEVSSLGRVRSLPRPGTKGGVRKIRVGKRGYPVLSLVQDGVQTTHEVHRLVALAFLGPRPEGALVRHVDGDALRPHADNLTYGTWGDNLLDQVRHGTHPTASRKHCPQGHSYSGANIRWYRDRRYCRACQRERSSRHPDHDPEWR